MPELTDAEIIDLFKKKHPRNLLDIRELGITPVYLKRGTSRTTFRIGQKLCLKLEFNKDKQSEYEITRIRKVNRYKKYAFLRAHVPPIYYGNKKTGTILTKFYEHYSEDADGGERKRLEILFREVLNVIDLHQDNFRVDEQGNHVVIDLGWRGYQEND